MPEQILNPEITQAAPSPECLQHFESYLAREANPAEAIQQLFAMVDESDEPLGEWLKSFEVFACIIEGTSHTPTLRQALGYLKCCQAVSYTGARYASFPMTVEVMLTERRASTRPDPTRP